MAGSTEGQAYDHDANGNLFEVSAVTIAYDRENRLSVHETGEAVTTYAYDGDGRKRSERSGSGVTTLVWDGDDVLQGRS